MYKRRNLLKSGLLVFTLFCLIVIQAFPVEVPGGSPPDLFSLYDYLADSPLLASLKTNIEKELAATALYKQQLGPRLTLHAGNASYGAKVYDVLTRKGNEQDFRLSPGLEFSPSATSGLSLTYGYNLSKSFDELASLDTQTHNLGVKLDVDTLVRRDHLNDLKTRELSLLDAQLGYKQQQDQFYLTMLELLTAYYKSLYDLEAHSYQLAIEEQEKKRLAVQTGANSTGYLKTLNTIHQLKQQMALNEQELSVLEKKALLYMGFKPADIRLDPGQITGRLLSHPLPPLTFEQFKANARRLPAIIQLENSLISKDIEVKRLNQQLIPDISFQANYSFNTRNQEGEFTETDNQRTGLTNSFSFSLGVSVPVDKYLTNKKEKELINLEKKELNQQIDEKLISLYFDYLKNLHTYEAALTDLQDLQSAVPVLEQDLREKEQLLHKNLIAPFDVQQIKAELAAHQKQYIWKVVSLVNSYQHNTLTYHAYLREEQ